MLSLSVSVIERLLDTSDTASIAVISIAVMLFCGFAMTRLTKLVKLPNVTAYIVTGILLGRYILNVIPVSFVEGSSFLADIALAFIAFSAGEFLKLDVIKKNGPKVIIITLFEAILTSVLVFVLLKFIFKVESMAFCLVISALSSATAPASTMMTIRQTKAKGVFVDTLLQVIALDNMVALLLYSVCISIAKVSTNGDSIKFMDICGPLLISAGIILLGGVFGLCLKLLMPVKRTNDNRLIIAVAMLFLFCGICAPLGQSPLLGCMSMGMVYTNIMSDDDKLFKQLGYFSPPILLLFFVRSGLNFDLSSLGSTNGINLGPMSLIVIAVGYFIIRIVGKYLGSFLGCLVTKKTKEERNYLGLALIPQAGVAIGLAALASREIGGSLGLALETLIIASSVLYELFGPACAKLSLYLSKSYSNNIEDIASVSELNPDGSKKSEVQLLIERINEIQNTIEHEEVNEDEVAFNEGAMELYNSNNQMRNWRKR